MRVAFEQARLEMARELEELAFRLRIGASLANATATLESLATRIEWLEEFDLSRRVEESGGSVVFRPRCAR